MRSVLVALFFIIFSQKVISSEQNFFDENFPDVNTYQKILFVQLKTYFETLNAKSIRSTSLDGMTTFVYTNSKNSTKQKLFAKIIRKISDNSISEDIIFSSETGNLFQVNILRKGNELKPFEDNELFNLKFKMSRKLDFYSIKIPKANLEINHQRFADENREVSQVINGLMEFNVQIVTQDYINFSERSYIYFSKSMPSPQASMTVKGYLRQTDLGEGIRYVYLSSQSGQLTPKQFFSGLNEGSMAFAEMSLILEKIIISLNFPNLDEENKPSRN